MEFKVTTLTFQGATLYATRDFYSFLISSFLIALREGAEAALVVGIVLVYLDRTARSRLARFVWAGVALAVAALSLVGGLSPFNAGRSAKTALKAFFDASGRRVFVVSMIILDEPHSHVASEKNDLSSAWRALAQKSDFAAELGSRNFRFSDGLA